MVGSVTLSVSTWQQALPPASGPQRAAVLRMMADRIGAIDTGRIRVAIDGPTAGGKTSFGHELASVLCDDGRDVFRASLDDFKRPWADRHLYDRFTGEGYYRNAYDHEAVRRLLLEPASPDGDGLVALCSIDPITQIRHDGTTVHMPVNGVLIVDGLFTLRPELASSWEYRVWLDVGVQLSVERGVARDAEREGREAAARLHRDRYGAALELYLAEAKPMEQADVIIDHTDFAKPRVLEA